MKKAIENLCSVLVLTLISISSFAQGAYIVSGTVTDESGQPAIGAFVSVVGTSTGTITDDMGRYSISARKDDQLEISLIGMATQRVGVNGMSLINIVLQSDDNFLETAVVVGYGTVKKGSITGAVSAIGGADMVKTKTENPQNMLTGRIPGVRVWQKTAEPGQYASSLDIRGMGSPLVVIDGVPREMTDFQRLTPSDIENVSVLKDASAAIYGLRGGNGVILITTKTGQAGKVRVSYDGNFTIQTPSSLPRQMDAVSSMILVNERSMGGMEGGAPEFSEELIDRYRSGELKGTDWNNLIIQNIAPQTRHDLSISGGTDRVKFYVGMGYMYQEGFWKSGDTHDAKYNLRANVTADIFKGMKFNASVSGYVEKLHNPLDDPELIIRYWWKQSTIWKAYADEEKTMLNYKDLELDWNSVARIYSDISGHRQYDRMNVNVNSSLNYDFGVLSPALQGLSLKGMFSWDYIGTQFEKYRKEYYQYAYNELTGEYDQKLYAASSPSQLTRTDNHYYSMLAQALLQYDRTFGKHHAGATLGWEVQKQRGNGYTAFGSLAFSTPYFSALSMEDHQVSQGALYEYAYQSLIGRVNYSYDERYLIEGQFRYDGSSRFYKGHQWGFFPSFSAGWRISREPWFKASPLNFINQLKLRVSYGVIGSDGSNYEWATGYTYPAASLSDNGFYTSNAPVYYLGSWVMRADPKPLANENITWYTNRTFDIGIDFEAWDGMLGITYDFFRRVRSGLLARNASDMPTIVGATPPLENVNKDSHLGFDLELSHRHRVGDFRYQLKGMMSITRNKYLHYAQSTKYANSYDNWRNNRMNNRYQGIVFGYETVGRYESWEDIWTYPINKSNGILPGDFKYLDWNGDGQINDLDQHPYTYGQAPWCNFSLSFDASWKGIDISILFQGAALGSVAFGEPQLGIWGQHGGGMLEQFYDRWHPVGVTTDVFDQKLTWVEGTYAYGGNSAYSNCDFNTQPIDYLRLKSIEIGYTFPAIRRLKDLSIRIYANAYNPLTFTGVKYIDPEHPADSYGRLYPLNKSYTFGLNLNF